MRSDDDFAKAMSRMGGVPIARSSLVPDGRAIYCAPMFGDSARFYVATHDRYGYPFRLHGERWPLYTRHTIGGREASRDRRYRRRR